MPKALLRLALVALSATALPAIASAQTELFFTEYEFNNPKIKSVRLDGSNLGELFTIPTSEWLPVGLDVDAVNGRVYWADSAGQANILGANLDGSMLSSLITLTGSARGVSLDRAGKLYYTDGNTLRRADLDGSNDELLFTAVQTSPIGAPYADGTNGHVYVGADHQIKRMDLDGSNVKTVVRGVSTPRAIDLDAANGLVYWIDANTISDYVGRARLDDSEFTVLLDPSPGVVQSSGLIDVLLDRIDGKLYVADDLADSITRADANGANTIPFYTSPPGLSPSGLALSTGGSPQALLDCNQNSVPDDLDIAQGTSTDCNDNGVPDECEADDPCSPPVLLLDQRSDPTPSSRTVGGPSSNPGSQWEVFQPFDVPSGGWTLGRLGLDGWTANYGDGSGFTATLFPDDGSSTFPDEAAPIASVAFNFRFSADDIVWVYADFDVSLDPGRYWVRLTSADFPNYHGAAHVATSGLGSISRSGLGNLFNAAPIAMRWTEGSASCGQVYCDTNPDNVADITVDTCNCSSGSIVLGMTGGAPGNAGYLLVGSANGTVTDPPGAQGDLCLIGAAIGRYTSDVGIIDGAGTLVTDILNAASGGGGGNLPSSLGNVCAPPGQSWNFQYWYRDGMSPSKFSTAITVTFQ